MKTTFIDFDDKKWKRCLAKTKYEFYQLPKFAQLEANLIGGKPIAWYGEFEEQWILIPLVKRRIPESITNGKEYYDLISPYGYPGIVLSNGISDLQLSTLLFRFRKDAKKETCISTFIRLNPISNSRLINEDEEMHQIIHSRIVSLDMKYPFEDQRMKYSSNHRRNIKKLLKSGFYLEWNNWDELESFIEIYNETMQREEADDYYFFPKAYYHSLKEIVGEGNIDLVLAKNPKDEAIAGGLYCKNENIVQYHLGGTKGEYLRKAPSKLLFDGVINRYSEEVNYFNLGGGVGSEQDSLFRFKEGFGKEYKKFSTLRIVNDRQRYNNLCQEYSKEELYNLSGYFPLYRKN